MPDIELPVGSLLLDTFNPRHREVHSQDEAIAAILARHPSKLLALAEHIASHGMNPMDRMLVLENAGGGYIVLEGNRRTAALKLMHNPDLCPDAKTRKAFAAIAADGRAPETVLCAQVQSREEAAPWLLVRHGGELDGAGIVRWSAGMRVRFEAKPGSQDYKAVAVLDWLTEKAEAGANQDLGTAIEFVFDEKLTTFGRLVSGPRFRNFCGFSLSDRDVTLTERPEVVVQRLSHVLRDFQGVDGQRGLSVSDLKSKDQRDNYVDGLIKIFRADVVDGTSEDQDSDDPEEEQPTPRTGAGSPTGAKTNPGSSTPGPESKPGGQSKSGSPATGSGAAKAKRGQPARPTKLFGGLKLQNCSKRTKDVLREIQQIDIDKFRNSAAALTRMLVELVVVEAIQKKGWRNPERQELKERVRTCLGKLDPEESNPRYKDVRNQIAARDSLISANTMNAFLHNANYFPSATELRSISDKYVGLLEDLDAEMGKV
ncbi:hypothetical protein [Micromonospora mirobrigensis]|uniref:ParB-like nuclease domain-containing protein n=1 Tax=Micromonospora mirobrigensis TaxID=262898 RepID=A0A1C4ZL70_9ACTN|nr:hypothetical protein [Micromonospora mirobrigensis]SCF33857.1 hypothetical protein GA0070564_10636 [Micromonospora mirobrigensis]